MKKILPFIILIGILISVNSTYACMPFEASTYVYFKPGSGVNMTMLENYCKADSCIIENSKIIYRSHFDSNIVIEVSKENVSNLELSRLGIIIPTNGTKFGGLSIRVDVANLSNSQILDFIKNVPQKWDMRDNFGALCALGFNCLKYNNCNENLLAQCMLNSDSKISEAKNKGLTSISFYTEAPIYVNENEAKSEIENFLSKYDLQIGDYSPFYVTNYVIEPTQFNWSAAMYLELKTLAENNILYGISDQDMIDIAAATYNMEYVYYRPENCKLHYTVYVKQQSYSPGEYGWLSAPGNCPLRYENNCPENSACMMCGVGSTFMLSSLPSSTLGLIVPSIEFPTFKEKIKEDNHVLYYILGVIIVIISIFFIIKNFKRK